MRPLAACLLLLLAACADPAPPQRRRGERPQVRVDRHVLGALRAYVQAGYEALLAREQPGAVDLSRLEERQDLAREALRKALLDAGADPAQVADLKGLVATVTEGISRGGRYGVVRTPSDPDSFAVVRVLERGERRELKLFGETFAYRLSTYDETLVEDYPTYRAARLKLPQHRETATYGESGESGVVRIDLGAARAVGESLFLPRVEALKAAARVAQDPAAFVARADPKQLSALLGLAKDALRWRSLEPLWGRIAARPRDEQVRRFALDYAERAELRAVAELRELVRLKAGASAFELSPARRKLLFELGSLSAMVHGDPLGHLADALALAQASLAGPLQAPHYQGARQLVYDLVEALRQGDEPDARALARLVAASPEALSAAAAALHRRTLERARKG